MTLLEFLRNIPNFQDYSRKSKILLLAYYLRQYHGILEFTSNDINSCCKGIVKPPSQLGEQLKMLSKGKDSLLIKGSMLSSFSISIPGLNEVEGYLSSKANPAITQDKFLEHAIPYLRKVLSKISSENQRKFIAEAISCLGVDAPRATIIMVWTGTIAHLYDYILAHRLTEFNAALHARTDKFSRLTVTCPDDFTDIREKVFIEVCRSANVISNDVRKILDEKLGIRNTCAHPSDVEIHKTKVVNFIEDLVDNVIVKYAI
ncbi:MAG: hypothetical protein HY606_14880 [Planctomycetes bacterium]|nr:hypothetical protein [Planctomycetota bacterium]